MILTIYNGPFPTTAAQAAVTTGTAIKTMLQVKGLVPLKIIEWGFSMNAFAAATPPVIELLSTGTVFATVTATVEADITKTGAAADLAADILTLGTTATGYTSSGEGSITATDVYEAVFFPPSGTYSKQFPLDQEPIIYKADAGRIRVTSGVAYNMYCWMRVKPA